MTRGSASRRMEARARLRVEPDLDTLNRLGIALVGQRSTEHLVKAVTDAGLAITGARFAEFRYKDETGRPARYFVGAAERLPESPASATIERFEQGFLATVSRSDDLPADDRYGPDAPLKDLRPPARSYLAAPVRSRPGPLLGGLFFAHDEPSFFRERDERMLEGLAAHAAIALDNAHLYREAQEARASAEAANGLKDAFLATLSHELRTPLTAISGWAHLLQRGQLSPPEAARAVDTIVRNASAQGKVIDELLDIARIVTGNLQLDLELLDIGAVVEAAIETLTPAARAKRIAIQFTRRAASGRVMGDPARLPQVFWNLLSNAIKFTSREGRVSVQVSCVASNIEVVVEDTGVGINAAFLPLLFDRFTQHDSSSTRRASGIGLGLSIARHLVDLHRGSLEAQSAGPGRGSTFTVRLPVCPETAPSSQPEVPPRNADAS